MDRFYYDPFPTLILAVLVAALLFDRGTAVAAALEAVTRRLAKAEFDARVAESRLALLREGAKHGLKNAPHAGTGLLRVDAARLAVLAHLHERLTPRRDSGGAVVAMRGLLDDIVQDLSATPFRARSVPTRVEAQAVEFDPARATSVGPIPTAAFSYLLACCWRLGRRRPLRGLGLRATSRGEQARATSRGKHALGMSCGEHALGMTRGGHSAGRCRPQVRQPGRWYLRE